MNTSKLFGPLVTSAILLSTASAMLAAQKVGVGRPNTGLLDEKGFKPIFNGQDLSGWDGNPKLWSV